MAVNMNKRKTARRPSQRQVARLLRGPFTLKKLIILVFMFISACAGYNYVPGKVVKVADGDTFTFINEQHDVVKVRLYGIDAPESKQEWGQQARDYAADLLFLEQVEIDIINKDRYGRSVAIVRLPDGRILNEELVRNGHAWVYRDYCSEMYCNQWITLEQEAKRKKAGLWAKKNPTAPWNWRKNNK